MRKGDKSKGIKSKFVFIPTIILIFLLQLSLGVTTVFMNKVSENMSNNMEESSNCISRLSDLSSGSSILSETACSFATTPIVPPLEVGGPAPRQLNTGALSGYFDELSRDENRVDRVLKDLKFNNLDTDLYNKIEAVSDKLTEQISIQAHVMYLINSTSYEYTTFPTEYLSMLPKYELTEEEKAMSDTQKIAEAKKLIFSQEYAVDLKKESSSTIGSVIDTIKTNADKNQSHYQDTFWNLRRLLWVEIALIIIVLVTFFAILYKKLISPILAFSNNITEGERLDDRKGLYEANVLANSYNELYDKRQGFEKELTSVAETDPLTGFENRYSYNKFLASRSDSNHSTCIFMLDINNLKYVNDTFGHDKGDELIKNSSLAIKETFMDSDGKNCYRLGGDEFIAIIDDIEESNINNYIYKFQEKQKEYKVSVATGYAYTSNVSVDGYEKLMIEADKRMYENKKEMKKQLNPQN